MTIFIFLALVSYVALFTAVQGQKVFQDDCAKYPGPCNNDCYAIFTAGKTNLLKRKQGASTENRKKAGCVPNPCGSKINKPKSGDTSCDEYPFAGTQQGGQGSLLRCTIPGQNTGEGGALGRFFQRECGTSNCEFAISFNNYENSKYCGSGNGNKNDGFEYVYDGSKYHKDSRDVKKHRSHYKLHEPDPEVFFPPHLRREFLLENGGKTLLLTRNLTSVHDGASVFYMEGDEILETRIVRELHGKEKSPALQPSTVEE